MNTSRHYPFCVIFLFLVTLASGTVNAGDFEEPGNLRASNVLSDALRSSKHHRVDEAVRSDGYLNYYVLRSDYGEWEVTSTALLAKRVREVEALVALDDVSKTEVFIKAAADAGVGQLKAVQQFATKPVETVTGIPKGIGNMFKRYSRQAEEAVDAAKDYVSSDDDAEEGGESGGEDDTNEVVELTEGYFGVSSAQRAWAQELGTDPYTSNEVLQAAIKEVAWADRLGRVGMKFAPIPTIPGADVIGEVNDVVWSKNPYELEDLNRARLAATGADDELIDAYLSSPHFTPTQLTYLTAALTEMDGVEGRDGILRQALVADTEAEVGFFVKSTTMLAWYHLNKKPLEKVLTEFVIPRGVAKDGTATLLFAADHVFWTETVANAADSYAALREEGSDRELELWLIGDVSERTAKELAERNITVYTNLVDFAD